METLVGTVIPPALQNRCRLIKLGRKSKAAIETGWETNSNYSTEDIDIISHIKYGANYGILPRNGLVVIDCDTEKLYDNLPLEWKKSLTALTGRTGETGRHVFLYCPDSPPEKTPIKDPETLAPLGDFRGTNSPFYTVGAGSIHPDSGKKYEYENPDAPLVEVTWEEVKTKFLDIYPIHFKKTIPATTQKSTGSLADKLHLRIEEFAMPLNPTQRSNGDIQGSHPIHGSTTGMNFSINPGKGVWHCYRDGVGGDAVAWIAYAHCGVDESRCSSLSTDEFKAVKEWLKDNGYADEIEALDDVYHADDFGESQVDLSGLYNPSSDLEDGMTDAELNAMIDEEMAAAKTRGTLPDFPELNPGLFHDYVKFGKIVTYSIPEFHFASSLAVISMAVGRKVKMKIGMTNAHPNMFVMVVGATTVSGKSAACNMAIDLLSPLVLHDEEMAMFNSVKIMRGTISEPALKQDLADVYNKLWYYDDCAGFFDTINDGWNKPMLGTLCGIYDGSPTEHTLSRTRDNVMRSWVCPEPFVSLLFNTTHRDIEQRSNSNMFSSGFSPRVMWFIGQGGSPRKNVERTEADIALERSIKDRVSKLKAALLLVPNDSIVFGVCDTIEQWRLDLTMTHLAPEDETFRVAISRGFIHAYKIAAMLAVTDPEFQKQVFFEDLSKYPIEIKLPEKHAIEAIKIVEKYLIPRTMYVYDLCNQSDERNHQIKVLKAIDHFGGVADRSSILRRTHMNSKDVTNALKTLTESGEIKICKRPVEGSTKSSDIIIKLQ